jgi:hypothetical protein
MLFFTPTIPLSTLREGTNSQRIRFEMLTESESTDALVDRRGTFDAPWWPSSRDSVVTSAQLRAIGGFHMCDTSIRWCTVSDFQMAWRDPRTSILSWTTTQLTSPQV